MYLYIVSRSSNKKFALQGTLTLQGTLATFTSLPEAEAEAERIVKKTAEGRFIHRVDVDLVASFKPRVGVEKIDHTF